MKTYDGLKPGKIKKMLSIVVPAAFFLSADLTAWEKYDRVIAIVNNSAIIESDVEMKFNVMQSVRPVAKARVNYEKSRILDQFIEDALISQTAEESSIMVNDKKVMNRMEGLLKSYILRNLKKDEDADKLTEEYSKRIIAKVEADRESRKGPQIDERLQGFFAYVKQTQNENFTDFFESVRLQILRQDFLTISLGVSPPAEQEARNWFNANKAKLGFEMWVKHILIIPKNNSYDAEREVNAKLADIRKRIMAGESFEGLARQYSQDPGSAAQGGDLGWIMPAGLDPLFAGNVFNSYNQGGVTNIFKSGFGYHIAKYYGRRAISFEKVYPMISHKLYSEKIEEQFKKWIVQRKKESDIRIYMKNYVKG
ncbi:MAG: peptidylprolyl isomerase [Leptospirales bacterium]|nr:peptidylprolyl isomerase [Leptospirales bacterium]